MRRRATQIWVGVLLAVLLAIASAGSAAEVEATPEPQVGDVPVCKIEKDGRERTKLVPPHKLEKKLEKDLKPGECPNPANGRVMCKIKDGVKIKNVLVKSRQVKEKLDKGWTLGVCGSL